MLPVLQLGRPRLFAPLCHDFQYYQAVMQFTESNIDLDGGISNPVMLLATGVWALALAISLLFVMRSRHSKFVKGCAFLGVLTLGWLGSWPVFGITETILIAVFTRPNVQIGFIGGPPSALLAPTLATVLALAVRGAWAAWRLLRI